jgi:hypothetical protein
LPKGPKINRSLISSKTPNHVVDAADCKAWLIVDIFALKVLFSK